ncbi:TerY-C metal binding domain-containing protein [Kingella sp. (in: b-proteobacteria)]|uniref:TerY-C metal binding domain-containing protein n=1 Tax=Kingella sp. (in: b-proteobacteria) TaxID=2020713 RepID=UPI0026DB8EE1|nr:TerY-C metal binding domain-containing protein [Kingella sp. (in: b-proteobacteria)]MDO4658731.1 TerY-C metal binding domain-containing protein [Kingella sp. (in: b-proteobacteria)]
MRRLPIFLVIDVSESMVGQPLRQMQEGISRLIETLRRDPYALETVYLSVIAFAGIAKTLAPLVELVAFYPPRLPVGSGTSLGVALNHAMDEIDRHVITNSPERKGDYKPVVYLMTDGGATDDPTAAIARWQRSFAHRANLVSIGIGPFADLAQLAPISHGVLRLDTNNEADFKAFIDWISQSVSSQSRSLGVDVPVSLDKNEQPFLSLVKDLEQATAVDENYVIISGLCSKTKLPYLMKYERAPMMTDVPFFTKQQTAQVFGYAGVFPVEADYKDWSDPRVNTHTVSTASLMGGGGCPHCGASSALCQCGNCGQTFCANSHDSVITCPNCQRQLTMSSEGGDFDVSRARG